MVAYSHIWLAVTNEGALSNLDATFDVTRLGGFGVDIFFGISGFLMIATLKRGLDRGPLAATFLSSRVQRIYPVYLFWLAVLLAGAALANRYDFNFARSIDRVDIPAIIGNALLLPAAPGNTTYFMYFPQGWTLVYEMYFYAVFALCLLVGGRRLILPALTITLGGLFVLFHFVIGQGDRNNWVSLRYMVGDPLVMNFFLGAILGALYQRTEFRLDKQLSCGLAALAIAALTLVAMTVDFQVHRFWRFGLPALGILAITVLIQLPDHRTTRLGVYLGEASYSIYLTHILFAFIGGKFGSVSPLPPDLDALLLSLIAVLFGCAAYSLVERPILQGIKQRRLRAQPSGA